MNKNILLSIVIIGLTSGCASVTRGTTDSFVIKTNPPGAKASMSNGLVCTTPCSLELPRKHAFTVTIEKEGYQSIETEVVPVQAGAGTAGMAGNVLLGGIIGMAVDAKTGAMKDLYPNPLEADLAEVGSEQKSIVVLPEVIDADEISEEVVSEEDTADSETTP